MAKGNILRTTVYLKERTYITPNYIRITLQGDQVPEFSESTIGINNKIFIPPHGLDTIHFPELDMEQRKWIYPAPEMAPIIRTYTHRGINIEKKELIIDFVAHGDTGPASAWAIHAPIGSVLGVAMSKDSLPLYPEADWYLLAGDATAIPVFAAILEDLPASAKGVAYIEVEGEENIQYLKTNSQVQIEWICNPTPGQNSQLPQKVKEIVSVLNETSRFAYIACEFSAVKELRQFLRKEQQWAIDEMNAYSYWKLGKSEDDSESDRRNERNI